MPSFAVGVARLRTLTAQWPWVPSIGQNLLPFTGNGDVSKWMTKSWVGRKTTNKQTEMAFILLKNAQTILCNSLLSQKSTDFPPFSLTNLDTYCYCADVTEKVWGSLTSCALHTDKRRQLLIRTYGTEKVWQWLTVLLYGLIHVNFDTHWRQWCTCW